MVSERVRHDWATELKHAQNINLPCLFKSTSVPQSRLALCKFRYESGQTRPSMLVCCGCIANADNFGSSKPHPVITSQVGSTVASARPSAQGLPGLNHSIGCPELVSVENWGWFCYPAHAGWHSCGRRTEVPLRSEILPALFPALWHLQPDSDFSQMRSWLPGANSSQTVCLQHCTVDILCSSSTAC